jgi:hypothetical protein
MMLRERQINMTATSSRIFYNIRDYNTGIIRTA